MKARSKTGTKASVEQTENRLYAGRDLVGISGPYHTLRAIARPPEISPKPTKAITEASTSQFLWAFPAAKSAFCSNSEAACSHTAA